jgi:hypothetical protein
MTSFRDAFKRHASPAEKRQAEVMAPVQPDTPENTRTVKTNSTLPRPPKRK